MTRRIGLLTKVRSELAGLSCQKADGAWVVLWSDVFNRMNELIAEAQADDIGEDGEPVLEEQPEESKT